MSARKRQRSRKEAEREKRDFNEKLDHERQSTFQTLQRLEQQKMEYDRLTQESSQIGELRHSIRWKCSVQYD